MSAATATEPALAAGARAVLSELGEDPGELSLSPIPGGASRETYLVERVETAGDRDAERWVLRRDPPGIEALTPMGAEFALMGLAGEAGVPVPPALAFEPGDGRFQTAGLLMEYVPGSSLAFRLLHRPEFSEAREHVPTQAARALAKVHSLGAKRVSGVLPPASPNPALEQVEESEALLDRIGEPFPVLELGFRWLRANAPEPVRPTLVHGDFRLGNLIVDEGGLRAVIDWELAHLGDPAEDIAWLTIRSWRFGNDQLPVAGMGSLELFLDDYEAAGGTRPDPDRLHFWSVLANLRWAAICARQANLHLTGRRPSVELASLGRRVCEPEWDMLGLMVGRDGSGSDRSR